MQLSQLLDNLAPTRLYPRKYRLQKTEREVWWVQDYPKVGLVALLILASLALTSHKRGMKLLGKNWKRLHRLVYVAGILVVLHSINGIIMWQKFPDYRQAITEMQIYGFIMGLLLILRIPQVRHMIRQLFKLPKQKREKVKNMT